MLPMLIAGTPTWILLSERVWPKRIDGITNALKIKTASSDRFGLMEGPPSVKAFFLGI
jgi:hypothetical protein